MKLPFVLLGFASVASVGSLLFATGCATSAADDIDSGTTIVDAGGNKDAGKDAAKDTSTVQDSSGPVCVPSCALDTDCQNSCAAPQQGIYCCDIATSLCYVSSEQFCPEPVDASGIDP
ncbi:hypothetical protein BH09MYX1_BH09MYX1_47850 [soil metagenome]